MKRNKMKGLINKYNKIDDRIKIIEKTLAENDSLLRCDIFELEEELKELKEYKFVAEFLIYDLTNKEINNESSFKDFSSRISR